MAQGLRRSAQLLDTQLQQRTQKMSGADTRVAFNRQAGRRAESLFWKRGGAELERLLMQRSARYSRQAGSTGRLGGSSCAWQASQTLGVPLLVAAGWEMR